MRKSIIIIGAGMGGMAAGCYGQINGYDTRIFEMHTLPGGQCTAWKRKGYTFDVCIHHLFGCDPGSKIYKLWNELGVMPRLMVQPQDCISVASPDGRLFMDYYDVETLEQHLNKLSPADSGVIKDYIAAIRLFKGTDIMGEMTTGSTWGLVKTLLAKPSRFKWFKPTMQQFAERFSDPFLKKAFPLLIYSSPPAPLFLHLVRHAYGLSKSLRWPVGGALGMAKSMEKRYQDLGGTVHYRSKVDKILVENDKAAGVKLDDGTEYRADIVISDPMGRKTILDMLGGRYINEKIRGYCAEPADETNWAVHVFLGVNRDLSGEPSALIMLLDKPLTIAGHKNENLEMQLYGFDKTLAEEGKGVIKVELVSGYSYWKQLYADKQKYNEEKLRVAGQVIDVLETRYPGIKNQVEVIDVPTIMTWERFMNGTHGFSNFPIKKLNFIGLLVGKGKETTLPGLANFYFAGAWATMTGALFSNANSGKRVINIVCREDGKKFRSSP